MTAREPVPGPRSGVSDEAVLHVREEPLPGIGRRYVFDLGHRQWLSVIVRRDGGREINVGSGDADEPDATARLEQAQAVAVASILTGARFSIGVAEDGAPPTGSVDARPS